MSDPLSSILLVNLPFTLFFLALVLGCFGRLDKPGFVRNRWVWIPACGSLAGIYLLLLGLLLLKEPVQASSPASIAVPASTAVPAPFAPPG